MYYKLRFTKLYSHSMTSNKCHGESHLIFWPTFDKFHENSLDPLFHVVVEKNVILDEKAVVLGQIQLIHL